MVNEHTGFWLRNCDNMLKTQSLKLDNGVQILAPFLNSCDFEQVT